MRWRMICATSLSFPVATFAAVGALLCCSSSVRVLASRLSWALDSCAVCRGECGGSGSRGCQSRTPPLGGHATSARHSCRALLIAKCVRNRQTHAPRREQVNRKTARVVVASALSHPLISRSLMLRRWSSAEPLRHTDLARQDHRWRSSATPSEDRSGRFMSMCWVRTRCCRAENFFSVVDYPPINVRQDVPRTVAWRTSA